MQWNTFATCQNKIRFLAGLWFLSFPYLVFTEDCCRILLFREIYPDSAFNKSIINNLTVDGEDQCQLSCYLQTGCKSYNLGPVSEQGKRVCELSSSHYESQVSHLESRPGFIYRPSDNLCKPPCPENKNCCPNDVGFSCVCSNPGFRGERCDEDVDECSLGTHNCDRNSMCQNTVGSFICTCSSDQVPDGDKCAGFPFHWALDGTDSLLTLRGSAGFVEQNNRLVLYLDGTGANFAETPAIPLRQTDLTISVWIKLVSPLSQDSVQSIYGDWSFPWQFRFFMMDSGCPHFQARRDVDGIDDVFALGVTEHHRVSPDVWSHVAVTWSRVHRLVRIFINGQMKAFHVADSNSLLDFKNSGHNVYDIGLKRDNSAITHAYLSDLIVFNRDLSEIEIRNDLFQSNPLHGYISSVSPGNNL